MKFTRSALLFVALLTLSGAFFPFVSRAAESDYACTCSYTRSTVGGTPSDVQTYQLTGTYEDIPVNSSANCTLACGAWVDNRSADTGLIYAKTDAVYALTDEAAAAQATADAKKKSELYTPQFSVDIPGLSLTKPFIRGGDIIVQFLPEYIAGVYRYALGIAAILAVVMIMIGGVQYIIGSSAGGEALAGAKTRITNAITGLVLVLSAYLVLYVVNPNLTAFDALEISYIAAIPAENYIEPFGGDASTTTCTGSDCRGVNDWQDCMLTQYGEGPAEVKAALVDVTVDYAGHKRTYQVHKKAAAAFQKAFDAIAASGSTYDITKDSDGGTYAWRAKRGTPSVLSNHSWGTAIDLTPSTNPYCPSACRDGDAKTACSCIGGPNCETLCGSTPGYDLPEAIVKAFKENGFTWLGDPQRTLFRDYMHFDYITGC